ncbi:uncharacterized protein FOMMEDRAFT_133808 [Fomitiporia mediterranea MF3/22]|uniref:uncharacterized protein n=1 Tax=Fomitiporia mediterranea (strain MF3/22) TaxID=694068 RepID=UPI00044092AE|nr:uncharacterized protein FOMMEDRAFT_133808 [Fomitiporia mediterranea MF3/22]EJD04566.1 hypothetical protein FOMMEDRAFT_133808 [Fomitiporia mediterranea MF3/22]
MTRFVEPLIITFAAVVYVSSQRMKHLRENEYIDRTYSPLDYRNNGVFEHSFMTEH